MMLKQWLAAFRLRTLPLALSTILMGNALSILSGHFKFNIFILSVVVTIALQILSNLANDYGDGVKGTDNDNRLGPTRAIQSGVISQKSMITAIIIFSILSLASGLWLVFLSLSNPKLVILFIALGLAAIVAAIKYTVGKKAYGYSGLGDVFVFIFFGLVGVLGAYYLQTNQFNIINILPAIAIGCFSTAVLNLNNMRDIENDKISNKLTLVVKMGLPKAKKYHSLLFVIAYLSLLTYLVYTSIVQIIGGYLMYGLFIVLVITLLIHLKHLWIVKKAKNYQAFDPQLKVVALSSFGLSLLWFGLLNWFI